MNAKIDRTGHRYGRLTVIREALPRKHPSGCKSICWACLCDCGSEVAVSGNKLASGYTRSCGCLKRDLTLERFTKHGRSNTQMFSVWAAIKERCFSPSSEAYGRYGGRGITMHPAWVSDFAAFNAYVGDRPAPGMSIDRIDNDRGYEPGNIRWATAKEQANNRRRRRRKTHCHLGHELTTENTYVQEKTGYRYCRACKALRDTRYKKSAE